MTRKSYTVGTVVAEWIAENWEIVLSIVVTVLIALESLFHNRKKCTINDLKEIRTAARELYGIQDPKTGRVDEHEARKRLKSTFPHDLSFLVEKYKDWITNDKEIAPAEMWRTYYLEADRSIYLIRKKGFWKARGFIKKRAKLIKEAAKVVRLESVWAEALGNNTFILHNFFPFETPVRMEISGVKEVPCELVQQCLITTVAHFPKGGQELRS